MVAIIGGGVAGLSAAHELAERGFQVTVYEASRTTGGKARSIFVPGTGTGGRRDLPGEHGFRFFPSFYRHLLTPWLPAKWGTSLPPSPHLPPLNPPPFVWRPPPVKDMKDISPS